MLYLEFLANCILVDASTVICWMSPFVFLGVLVYFVSFIIFNDVDPDQMSHFDA